MAIREGRATPENAIAVVSPGRVRGAWQSAGELPREVYEGMGCLSRGDSRQACGLLFENDLSDNEIEEVEQQYRNLRTSDPEKETHHLYAELTARRTARAYLPHIPIETRWAWERHRALGRTERMITLRTEIACELDEWGVVSPALRREQAAYIEAIDYGFAEYRSAADGIAADKTRKK